MTINNSTGAITFNEEFYSLGQMTKVVQPNAVRIDSTTTSAINTVAFLNPDGTQALIALNPNASAATIRVVENGQHFNYSIPAKSVVSFQWSDKGADFNNGGFDDGGFQSGGGSLDAWNTFGNTTGNVSAASDALLRRRQVAQALRPIDRQSQTPPACFRESRFRRATICKPRPARWCDRPIASPARAILPR